MKRASYRAAVAWIAANDSPGVSYVADRGLLTIALVADLFGVERARVARDVVIQRARAKEAE